MRAGLTSARPRGRLPDAPPRALRAPGRIFRRPEKTSAPSRTGRRAPSGLWNPLERPSALEIFAARPRNSLHPSKTCPIIRLQTGAARKAGAPAGVSGRDRPVWRCVRSRLGKDSRATHDVQPRTAAGGEASPGRARRNARARARLCSSRTTLNQGLAFDSAHKLMELELFHSKK